MFGWRRWLSNLRSSSSSERAISRCSSSVSLWIILQATAMLRHLPSTTNPKAPRPISLPSVCGHRGTARVLSGGGVRVRVLWGRGLGLWAGFRLEFWARVRGVWRRRGPGYRTGARARAKLCISHPGTKSSIETERFSSSNSSPGPPTFRPLPVPEDL